MLDLNITFKYLNLIRHGDSLMKEFTAAAVSLGYMVEKKTPNICDRQQYSL